MRKGSPLVPKDNDTLMHAIEDVTIYIQDVEDVNDDEQMENDQVVVDEMLVTMDLDVAFTLNISGPPSIHLFMRLV